MTQFYELEARRLESAGNNAPNGSLEQARHWIEAAKIGTVVQLCGCTHELWPKGATRCDCCGDDCFGVD